jgi:2,4-dienoyl-CoA reductase-like NADH-dependent reductase (Old Yellow Enzyme family)
MPDIFSPMTIKNNEIKNRIVLPPMVRFGWSDDKGFVSKKHIEHYSLIAEKGPGLIIIEALAVEKDGRLSPDQLGIWSDDHIEGISKIAENCQNQGAIVTAQIHHAGLSTPTSVSPLAVAPSDHYREGEKAARALTLDEIKRIQDSFSEAAGRALKAGLNGVEIHGAHGFLIDQFVSPVTNKRDDAYGGDISRRTRFPREIISKIKETAKDKDFIIGYRMGGNAPTIQDGAEAARILENVGIDLLHISSGIAGESVPEPPEGFKYNWIVYTGTEIKKDISVPVIVVNSIRTPEQASYLIKNGMADFAAIGKGLLCDPEWVEKAGRSEKVNECLECDECNWFSEPEKCPRYKKFLKQK